jgi:predicted lactoylglutathione lyase
MDMKLEVVVLPVSDVDKAKDFYQGLGWRLDADFAKSEDFRVVQLTGAEGRAAGPAPERKSYGSFVSFSDPDGNGWFVQEVTTRLPGR